MLFMLVNLIESIVICALICWQMNNFDLSFKDKHFLNNDLLVEKKEEIKLIFLRNRFVIRGII